MAKLSIFVIWSADISEFQHFNSNFSDQQIGWIFVSTLKYLSIFFQALLVPAMKSLNISHVRILPNKKTTIEENC